MCGPAAIAAASFAFSAVSTIAQYEDQKAAAKAQADMINHGNQLEQAALSRQYEEIQAVSKDDQAQRYKDYLVESARLKTIGAESGLYGATQDRVEQESQNNATTDMATIEANRQRQVESAHTGGVSRANQASVQLAGIRKPSALGAGLQIAGSAASTYLAYDAKSRPAQ